MRSRKRRLVAGLAALVLQRLQKRRLLAEDVPSRRDEDLDGEAAQAARGGRGVELPLQGASLRRILVAEIDDAALGADGASRQGDAFEHEVGRFGKQHAILE